MGNALAGLARRLALPVLRGALCCALSAAPHAQTPVEPAQAAVLVYHRFGPVVADSMTTRTEVFRAQLDALRQAGYHFVTLKDLVAGLQGSAALPAKAVAITADDGHRTVYTDMLPVIREQHLPVTLFIYPSAISNASYALTWEQLQELAHTDGVDIQSHTFWHPNFHTEKRRLSPEDYQRFVRTQLEKPRQVLKQKLGVEADCLAWPFGIYDDELDAAARAAGYRAAFILGNRNASGEDPVMALPRYLIVDAVGVNGLLRELQAGVRTSKGSRP